MEKLTIEKRRYIGCKAKLIDWIIETIQHEIPEAKSFCDIFAGTAVVSQRVISLYKKVIINDFLYSNNVIYKAFFEDRDYHQEVLDSYVEKYNNLSPDSIAANYFSDNYGDKYFDMASAKRIGFIREDIESHKSELTEKEYCVLITSLIYSIDRIANTLGHFEAYIKKDIKVAEWNYRLVDFQCCKYAFPISSDKEPDTKLIAGLNEQLHYLQELLVTYLKEITVEKPEKIQSIEDAMYAPFINDDFSIEGTKALKEHKSYWENHEERDKELISIVEKFGLDTIQCKGNVRCWREDQPNGSTIYPPEFLLPKNIMVLNFNYTHTAQIYCNRFDSFEEVHIHGDIENGDSIIFGYGDELHADFAKLKEQGNDECLRNVKSIRYMEAPNYRQMLSFIESEPFQVLILGHSCGLSDRTLLNTIFEHPNCVSIKPYYYITDKEKGTDNYIELVLHISRNFNDMKLMRDRVVNKTQCEPLVKE